MAPISDAELVEILHRPSTRSGSGGDASGDSSHLSMINLGPLSCWQTLSVPVRLPWGERDPGESPAEALEWKWNNSMLSLQELRVLPGLGHLASQRRSPRASSPGSCSNG